MGLDRSTYLEEQLDVRVTWLPFLLHPEIPAGGMPTAEMYRRLGIADVEGAHEHLRRITAAADLPFAPPTHAPNTRVTLEASEWVRQHAPEAFDRFHRGVFHAYWAAGRDIEDRDVLRELAADAGAPTDQLDAALDAGEMGPVIDRHKRDALEVGVSGTPAWLIDRRFLVPGAQPREVFERVITRMRATAP